MMALVIQVGQQQMQQLLKLSLLTTLRAYLRQQVTKVLL